MNIENKIENFLVNYDLLTTNNVIIVGFSGGYDSTCLLHLLSSLSKKYEFNLVACHLNHNWRGNESLNEAKNCEIFCKSINVEFYSETLPDNTIQSETVAREKRYAFFEKCAKKFKSNCFLTAHNYDDNAETIVYRLAKGTGTAGLEGIKEKRGIYYRPLLSTTRADIEAYCKINSLKPNEDSSNNEIKYKRNLIRKEIFPLFAQINPDFKSAINNLSSLAKAENNYFENFIDDFTNQKKISTNEFLLFDRIIQSKIIYKKLKKRSIDYDKTKIDYLVDFIHKNQNSKSGKVTSITSDIELFVNNKSITFLNEEKHTQEPVIIDKCGLFSAGNADFIIEKYNGLEPIRQDNFPLDNEKIAYVDLSNFENDFEFVLRHRNDGDIIQPFGMNGTQKIKKYLNEKKIPKHEKDSLLFLAKNNEILWAISLGISEKIKVAYIPTHVIKYIQRDIKDNINEI
ncbi:MAG: tRNA lysidine(34) synthetase TilS [Candidatus Gastranaerophilales bacterium]